MPDGSGGFQVVPDRLRTTAATLDRVSDHWRGVLGELGVRIADGACQTGDGAVTEVLSRLGFELREGGLALARVLDEDAAVLRIAAVDYVSADEGAAGAFDAITVGGPTP